MARTLTAAVIGCGAFSRAQHFPNCGANQKVSVKWACDISRDAAERAKKDFGIPQVTTNEDDIFNDPSVDLVILATSHEAHLSLIQKAGKAGKHVLCEKPLAMTSDDGIEIIRTVQQNKIKLCVDQNRRTSPSLVALKNKYRAFKADPKHQPWRYVETSRPSLPDERYTNFLVRVQDESASYRLVHLDPHFGGGQIIGESCHWLDLSAWLFDDDEPVSVQAWGSAMLSHGINISFRSGSSATILFNCGGSFDYPKEMFEITYNGALFRNECFLENQIYGIPGEGREIFALQHDGFPAVGAEGGLSGYLKKIDAMRSGSSNMKSSWNDIAVNKGHAEMLDGFIDAILNDTAAPCTEVDGFRAVYLARLAIESIRTGHAMPVEMRYWHPFVHLR